MNTLIRSLIVFLLSVSTAHAHAFWVNCFESTKAHPSGHVTVSLGWGHAMPVDDMLNSPNGRINVEKFNLIDPAGNKKELYLPKLEKAEPLESNADYDLYVSNIANQQIALKKETKPGVYLIEAMTKKNFYTAYTDTKGRDRLALKTMDEIDDIKKVHVSLQYQAFAKSYLTVGQWTTQEPVGHGLEITPLTDLSQVKIGDMVEFDVRFNGEPLSAGPNKDVYITGSSPTFGGDEGFAMYSGVTAGKARFRVQCPGQWRVNMKYIEPVTKDGPLKDLYGKVKSVNNVATLTFTVKP